MQKIKQLLFFIFVAASLTSCYTYRSVGLMQEDNRRLPNYEKAEYEHYRLRVNDELIYRLMTTDEAISKLMGGDQGVSSRNTISYRVHVDGTVDFPFVKKVPVAGLTITEAEKVVEQHFRTVIPDATLKLAMANKTFTVLGEGGTGVYSIFRDKLTIFQALSMSGDLNNSADFKRVRIIRETDNGVEELEFDIRTSSVIDSKYYYVYPNDIIYVQKAASSFYKVPNYGAFIGIVSSSVSFLVTVLYYLKF